MVACLRQPKLHETGQTYVPSITKATTICIHEGESGIAIEQKQKKRSPLRQMPLRNPGESLEGEMQRLLNDRAVIPFMAATLALMFAVWE
jgi:hypothetical protein